MLFLPDFVAVDIETTGLDPASDAIIQVGAVRIAGGAETNSFESVANPHRPVSLRIRRLTGLGQDELDGAPEVETVIDRLVEFVGQAPVVGHNISFDLGFLKPAMSRCGVERVWEPVLDSLPLARLMLPGAPNHRLGTLAEILGAAPDIAHQAGADARASADLFLALQRKLWEMDFHTLGIVARLLSGYPGGVAELVRGAYRERSRFFGGGSQRAAAAMPATEMALTQPAAPVGAVSPEGPSTGDTAEVSLDDLDTILGPGGRFSKVMPGYEYRSCQEDMLNLVRQAFDEGHHLFVEAGTGTGKSLAYLLPAVYWSLTAGEKVVISTHTINLQEQLITKDIPLVRRVTGLPFRAAVVKGRSNYLCRRKWSESLEQDPAALPGEEAFFLAQMASWLSSGGSGDRGDLSLTPDQEEYWSALGAHGEACLGEQCPQHEQCFVQQSRRQAAQADLVIVNHSLLLADLTVANRVLPPYRYLICDEGHNLEDVATDHLGVSVGRYEIRRWLGALFRGYRGGFPGLLGTLRNRVTSLGGFLASGAERLTSLTNEATESVESCRNSCDRLFDGLAAAALAARQEAGGGELPVMEWRLHPGTLSDGVLQDGENACSNLKLLGTALGRLAEALRGAATSQEKAFAGWPERLASYGLIAAEAASKISLVLTRAEEDYVYWVETSSRANSEVTLRAAPVDVGPLVKASLFDHCRSVVVTSATLAVGGDFGYVTKRLGLSEEDGYESACLASPFHYDEQALACVLRDAPHPRYARNDEVVKHLIRFLTDLIGRTKGRTLVLFTSYRMMGEVAATLRPALEDLDICLLVQGQDGSRSRLVEEFREQERTVLMGTASFWEGVDVPGDALSCVVIVRLPFWPPGRPVVEARSEAVVSGGGDAFADFAVPQAIIRFKQGFGRLIRTSGDRGAVVICDPRAATQAYGRRFLQALPGPRLFVGSTSQVARAVEVWLRGDW